jgi:hypothetical protein
LVNHRHLHLASLPCLTFAHRAAARQTARFFGTRTHYPALTTTTTYYTRDTFPNASPPAVIQLFSRPDLLSCSCLIPGIPFSSALTSPTLLPDNIGTASNPHDALFRRGAANFYLSRVHDIRPKHDSSECGNSATTTATTTAAAATITALPDGHHTSATVAIAGATTKLVLGAYA